jgi:hypothetical protein
VDRAGVAAEGKAERLATLAEGTPLPASDSYLCVRGKHAGGGAGTWAVGPQADDNAPGTLPKMNPRPKTSGRVLSSGRSELGHIPPTAAGGTRFPTQTTIAYRGDYQRSHSWLPLPPGKQPVQDPG